MNRDELEAAIWAAMSGLKPRAGTRLLAVRVDEILAAADAYAAGDSDQLTALRRDVLHHAAAPPPGGTP